MSLVNTGNKKVLTLKKVGATTNVANFAALPGTGTVGVIYKALDTGHGWMWDGIEDYTDVGTNFALDVNGHLCSLSGLGQATKANDSGDPDYIAPYASGDCPEGE